MIKTCRDWIKNVATDKNLLRQVKNWHLSVAMFCEEGKVFA